MVNPFLRAFNKRAKTPVGKDERLQIWIDRREANDASAIASSLLVSEEPRVELLRVEFRPASGSALSKGSSSRMAESLATWLKVTHGASVQFHPSLCLKESSKELVVLVAAPVEAQELLISTPLSADVDVQHFRENTAAATVMVGGQHRLADVLQDAGRMFDALWDDAGAPVGCPPRRLGKEDLSLALLLMHCAARPSGTFGPIVASWEVQELSVPLLWGDAEVTHRLQHTTAALLLRALRREVTLLFKNVVEPLLAPLLAADFTALGRPLGRSFIDAVALLCHCSPPLPAPSRRLAPLLSLLRTAPAGHPHVMQVESRPSNTSCGPVLSTRAALADAGLDLIADRSTRS